MINSPVRWHVSLPGEQVDGVLLPFDDTHVVRVDDPDEVSDLVQFALAELDESADGHGHGDWSWPDVRMETASGEQLIVRILHRSAS